MEKPAERNVKMELSAELLTADRITHIVQCILADSEATLLSWQCDPITYASVGVESRGLFRLHGMAMTESRNSTWSVILKVFRPLPDGSTTPADSSHYWKREGLAYTSDLLEDLPEGVRVPSCYGLEEMEDGSLWLWLEEAQSDMPPPWPLSRFRLAAYHLGLWNGRFLLPHSLPEYPWLSREMTRVWAEENAYTLDLIAQSEVWQNPPLSVAFVQPVRERLLRLWKERERFYTILAALPQTICHHDAGHRNVFACHSSAGQAQTLLIDWELVGYGAIGEELGNLFATALINFEVEPHLAEAFAQTLLDGYAEGLHAAGWQGDPRTIRTGFAIAAVFRWVFAAAGWPVAIATDSSGRAERQTWEQWGKPMEQVYHQWAGLAYFLLDFLSDALSTAI